MWKKSPCMHLLPQDIYLHNQIGPRQQPGSNCLRFTNQFGCDCQYLAVARL